MAKCYSWIEFLAFYPHKLFLLRTEFAGQKNRTFFSGWKQTPEHEREK